MSKTNKPEELQSKIIALFPSTEADFQYSYNELSQLLDLHGREDKIDLSLALQKLLKTKVIQEFPNGKFGLAKPEEPKRGKVDFVNPRFAYVRMENKEAKDVYIPADDLKGAQDGDLVEIDVFNGRKKGSPEGVVTRIVERARTHYVGTLSLRGDTGWLTADYRKMHDDILVHEENLNGAKNGQKVQVEIRTWGGPNRRPIGVVTEVLGMPGENETEMHAILADFNIPLRFSAEVEAEVAQVSGVIDESEIKNRRDFRKIPTFTIDPFDAKDFDDALSIRPLEDGFWEIGIHIADVSHFLKPGTELDKAALERATSIYLVDRVSPMLPERLSNDLCSLRPNEDRLTFSCVLKMDENGLIKERPWIGRTIIHSDRRFTYEEVQEVLEGKENEYQKELIVLNQMAHVLRNRRLDSGAMSFESTEVKFVLDERGVPLRVIPKIRKDAHKLIEEFMLLANRSVAEFAFHFKEGREQNPMMYRIHESPNSERLQTFAGFAGRFGYKINVSGDKVAKSLNAMVASLEGKPEQELMQNLAIRVMAKARYTVKPIGHFGLAFSHYSHFTSPIRRYPDVLTHRLLWNYLQNEPRMEKEPLEKLCIHCSEKEKNAADAERASIKYKQVEYMALQNPDKVYEGVVSGVTEWGVYVDIIENRCEGMVRLTDITVDHFDFLEDEYCLEGRRTRLRITFGDKVRVRVKGTNLEKRSIDFYLDDAAWNLKSTKEKPERRGKSDQKKGMKKGGRRR